jgi:hypothetical protein
MSMWNSTYVLCVCVCVCVCVYVYVYIKSLLLTNLFFFILNLIDIISEFRMVTVFLILGLQNYFLYVDE